MNGNVDSVRAIVTHAPENGQPSWKLQVVTLRELGKNELLVRIVSTGICHTDLVFSAWPKEQFPYPRVLGHEGQQIIYGIKLLLT
jgi:D-arabinose 1-dehydrogenase-like Zn-dependent alcohol dehydrogenase